MLALLASDPAASRIVKTRSANGGEGVDLVVGIGAEWSQDEYAVPLLIEWSPTPALTLTLEPGYAGIRDEDHERKRGAGETETCLLYTSPSPRD